MSLKWQNLLKNKLIVMKKILFFSVLFLLLIACRQNKEITQKTVVINKSSIIAVNQQTIIYKTINDFSDNVPVIMNAGRTKILSYPAPSDIVVNGKLSKPTQLKNGYLLDNRGITENVVFLNYSYEVYSKLKEVPSLNEMLKNIKEKYPLKEFIYCGSRYQFKDEVKELNALIDAGLPGCKKAEITPMRMDLKL